MCHSIVVSSKSIFYNKLISSSKNMGLDSNYFWVWITRIRTQHIAYSSMANSRLESSFRKRFSFRLQEIWKARGPSISWLSLRHWRLPWRFRTLRNPRACSVRCRRWKSWLVKLWRKAVGWLDVGNWKFGLLPHISHYYFFIGFGNPTDNKHSPSNETKLFISAITNKHSVDACWLEEFQQNFTQKDRLSL